MFSHMAWAMKLPIQDPSAKWLLVTLCDYTNQDGKCWPSQHALQERTALGRATINRKLRMLEDMGLIKRISGRTGFNTEYFILMEGGVSQRDNPVSERDTKLPLNNNNSRRGTRVDEDFKPTAATVAKINQLCDKEGIQLDHDNETAKFCDYHIAKGSVFKDHQAAYRNWCRNAINYAKSNGSRQTDRSGIARQSNTLGDRFRAYVDSIDY